MNTDIRLRTDFFDHPKTRRFKRTAKKSGIYSLLRLWTWAAMYHPDGDLSSLSPDEIEEFSDWSGKRGEFFAAITNERHRFLAVVQDEKGNFLEKKLRNWEKNQKWVTKEPERKAIAAKAASARYNKDHNMLDACTEQCTEHAQSNAQCNAPSPSPALRIYSSISSSSLRSEEEISDKYSSRNTDSSLRSESCGELAKITDCSPAKPGSKTVFEFPVLGGGVFNVTQTHIDTFVSAYPACDILGELGRARAWVLSNPKNAKKDVLRFVNNWLCRTQDRATQPARNGYTKKTATQIADEMLEKYGG